MERGGARAGKKKKGKRQGKPKIFPEAPARHIQRENDIQVVNPRDREGEEKQGWGARNRGVIDEVTAHPGPLEKVFAKGGDT